MTPDLADDRRHEERTSEPIAIIGMACRFPKAPGLEAFWDLLERGVDAVTEWPRDRVGAWPGPLPALGGPLFGSFLEDVEDFDPAFFDLTAKEAASMDPQQRLILEMAWQALEDAGQSIPRLAGSRTGVFVGAMNPDHQLLHAIDLERIDAQTCLGGALGLIANRVSFALGLGGPSVVIDTQCSSSLAAIHLGCQSLRTGDAGPVVLAGGVNVILHPGSHAFYKAAALDAPDGRCKSFDARANGIVRGEGAGLVVLKRLSAALADGDRIHAIIRGSALNHDGRSNGLTAPSAAAQQAVLLAAYQSAGVAPGSIQYVEAHGTGTLLGDPIEAKALGAVMGRGRPAGESCAIGSVKTNLGHLESAAGVAGLIKAVLALARARVPASLHFQKPNPYIPLERLGLRVQREASPWPPVQGARRAGVSSFGLGGTNVHVVLEEGPAPATAVAGDRGGDRLLVLSARGPDALARLASQVGPRLAAADEEVGAFCAGAALRRGHLRHRLAVVGGSGEELAARLASATQDAPPLALGGRAPVVMVFSGTGSPREGMGRELLAREPVFREAMREVDRVVRAAGGASPLEELARAGDGSHFDAIDVMQPVVFAMQVALVSWWSSLGVRPSAVIGHSVGEVAAAHVAGVLSLEAAVRVVVQRSRLLARTRGRTMSVWLSAAEAAELPEVRAGRVHVACLNGPQITALAGEEAALAALAETLQARGIECRWIRLGVAAHTPEVEGAAGELPALLAGLTPARAQIPLYSTVTGERLSGEGMDAAYWGRNLRSPVRFVPAVERIAADLAPAQLLEIAPTPLLLPSIEDWLEGRKLASAPPAARGAGERRVLLEAVARLHRCGLYLDLRPLFPGGQRFVALPHTPFERRRCALAPPGPPSASPRADEAPRFEIAWRRAPAAARERDGASAWLIVAAPGDPVATALETKLIREGREVAVAPPAKALAALAGHDRGGLAIVDLAALRLPGAGLDPRTGWEAAHGLTGRALSLAQAVARRAQVSRSQLWLVTRGAQRVPGAGSAGDRVSVEQAPLLGLGRTMANELPELWGGLIDLPGSPRRAPDLPRSDPDGETAHVPAALGGDASEREAAFIFEQVTGGDHGVEVALRNGEAWVPRLVPAGPGPAAAPVPVRADRSYLVTGGLGALGLAVARWLVERGARNLALLGRSAPSPAAAQALEKLRAAGARVLVLAADVAEPESLARARAEIEAALPPLAGMVHAAGLIDDRPLDQEDAASLARVMSPKVRGALALEAWSAALPLDFFALFSSAASVLGSPGQASYAAGNAFLDALAHDRVSRGLPALSAAFGPWADVGLASDARRLEVLARRGLPGLRPALALAALGSALEARAPLSAILAIEPDALARSSPPALRAGLLAELLAGSSEPAGEPRRRLRDELSALAGDARRERLLAHLRARVGAALGLPPASVDAEAPLSHLGLDSLAATQLRTRLSESLDTSLPLAIVLRGSLRTLAEAVLAALADGAPAPADATSPAPAHEPRVLVPIRKPAAARLSLFCFPHAGGNAATFRAWSSGLPEGIEVHAVQLAGRGDRLDEAPLTRIERIADEVTAALLPRLDRPFAFFGHCLGAILAFEVLQRLREQHGRRAEHFFASGAPAPQLYLLPDLHTLPEPRFLEMLRLIGFTSTELLNRDGEMRALAMPSLRADFEVVAHYRHRPRAPLASPITAFGAFDDVFAGERALEAWREQTTAAFAMFRRPGNHYFIETESAFLREAVGRTLAGPATAHPWIRRLSPARPGGTRLLCFPSAGGAASSFAAFAQTLGGEAEVWAVDLPGRGAGAEAAPRSVEQIVRRLQEEIAPLCDRPLVMFGHDIGAIEMFELARAIEGRAALRGLIVSAAVAPHLYAFPPLHLFAEAELRDLLRFFGIEAPVSWQAARADFEVVAGYRHGGGVPVACPIVALAYAQDTLVPASGVERWSAHTRGGFTFHQLEGDHGAIWREPERALALVRSQLL
jgi:acyl transferase domain-containing protein/surfactin synthase thioesterase subunit